MTTWDVPGKQKWTAASANREHIPVKVKVRGRYRQLSELTPKDREWLDRERVWFAGNSLAEALLRLQKLIKSQHLLGKPQTRDLFGDTTADLTALAEAPGWLIERLRTIPPGQWKMGHDLRAGV